ncbi:MAG: hypothetical protein KBA06_06205, partial [Saprospiraceae bacterium]|nr:hypothetical protein [Saprospiraceae bacterium]
AKQLIAANKIETFTNKDAESSAKLLWESSELARALDKPKESLQILDQIIAKYPSFSNMANVEFMKAFTLDYNLHEFEKAKPLYESFLKKYHAHPLANDAKFMLEQNGKNDEDISKAIIKK